MNFDSSPATFANLSEQEASPTLRQHSSDEEEEEAFLLELPVRADVEKHSVAWMKAFNELKGALEKEVEITLGLATPITQDTRNGLPPPPKRANLSNSNSNFNPPFRPTGISKAIVEEEEEEEEDYLRGSTVGPTRPSLPQTQKQKRNPLPPPLSSLILSPADTQALLDGKGGGTSTVKPYVSFIPPAPKRRNSSGQYGGASPQFTFSKVDEGANVTPLLSPRMEAVRVRLLGSDFSNLDLLDMAARVHKASENLRKR